MFTLELEGIDDLERDWNDALGAISDGINKGVADGVAEGAQEARATHRWTTQTGATERGIRGVVVTATRGGAEGYIESAAEHSSFLEEGTAPHEIRPKEGSTFEGPLRPGQGRRGTSDIGTTRRALRWTSGGETRFAVVVHHPGTQPSPFMGPALLKAERVIEREVEIAEEKAARILDR
jgi:hypothetical protein